MARVHVAGHGRRRREPRRRRPVLRPQRLPRASRGGGRLAAARLHGDLRGLQRRRALRAMEPLGIDLRRVRPRRRMEPIAQKPQTIRAGFAAMELSRDFSWARIRLNALYQSADKDPFDGKATGFDAILENPQFAGAETSFWIRQAVPLVGRRRSGALGTQRHPREPALVEGRGAIEFREPGTRAHRRRRRFRRDSARARHRQHLVPSLRRHDGAGCACATRLRRRRKSAGTSRRRCSGGPS